MPREKLVSHVYSTVIGIMNDEDDTAILVWMKGQGWPLKRSYQSWDNTELGRVKDWSVKPNDEKWCF